MSFGCPECCWWLNGHLASYAGEELTERQEKLIINRLAKARMSVDRCPRPLSWDCEAESIVDWLFSPHGYVRGVEATGSGADCD